ICELNATTSKCIGLYYTPIQSEGGYLLNMSLKETAVGTWRPKSRRRCERSLPMLLCTWGLSKHIGRRILAVDDFADLPALISWLFVKPKNGGPTLAEMAQNKVRIYRNYCGRNERRSIYIYNICTVVRMSSAPFCIA